MSPRVMHADVGAGRPADVGNDEGTARFQARLLEILSRGPGSEEGHLLVDVLLNGSGAAHVAFLKIEGLGSRVVFRSTKPGFTVVSIPASLVFGQVGESVSTAVHEDVTWTVVAKGDSLLLAAFECNDVAGGGLFASVGLACATFLAKCASASLSPDSAWAMLGAVSSLFHDTLNLVTGLSLCLGAYMQHRLAGRKATSEEEAVLDKALVSLESLCREYARMARAARAHTEGASGRAMMLSYVDVLKRFGVDIGKVRLSGDFALSAPRQGIALRALMDVAAGLLQVGGRGVRVRADANRGVARISVAFMPKAPASVVLADQALSEGVELVNSRGGRAVLALRSGVARVAMSFADGYRNGERELT